MADVYAQTFGSKMLWLGEEKGAQQKVDYEN
jgi:hypothetical protein